MDFEASRLISPPNFGGGGGSCCPPMVVVALGEPGVPVICGAWGSSDACCALAGSTRSHTKAARLARATPLRGRKNSHFIASLRDIQTDTHRIPRHDEHCRAWASGHIRQRLFFGMDPGGARCFFARRRTEVCRSRSPGTQGIKQTGAAGLLGPIGDRPPAPVAVR